MDNEQCGVCRYFNADDYPDTEYGGCRRYPPQFDYVPGAKSAKKQVVAKWPSVLPADWCGEYRPAASTAPTSVPT